MCFVQIELDAYTNLTDKHFIDDTLKLSIQILFMYMG